MKKLFLFALCIIGFMLIAAPVDMDLNARSEGVPVLLNGRTLGNAQTINGISALKLDELARAGGVSVGLEPFVLQGSTLTVKLNPNARLQSNALFHFRKAGIVSSRVFIFAGKQYVPVADVAHAFGILNFANTRMTESVTLNFSPNPDAILGN